MLLENIANNDLGKSFYYMFKGDERHFVPINYQDYVNYAYDYIVQDIFEFENADSICQIAKKSVISSCFWFIGIESFVNSLLKVLCLDNNIDYSIFAKKTLNSRIAKINKFLFIPHEVYCKTGIQTKLNEFECFRNEIFHDRSLEKQLNFEKTLLAPNPCFPNFISEIQAMDIAISFFSFYRYTFKDMDIMPNVIVRTEETFIYEKLDKMYKNVLVPAVKKIIIKHNLETKFSFNDLFPEADINHILINYSIKACIKAIPSKESNLKLSENFTNILNTYFSKYVQTIKINKDEFRLPNFQRP